MVQTLLPLISDHKLDARARDFAITSSVQRRSSRGCPARYRFGFSAGRNSRSRRQENRPAPDGSGLWNRPEEIERAENCERWE